MALQRRSEYAYRQAAMRVECAARTQRREAPLRCDRQRREGHSDRYRRGTDNREDTPAPNPAQQLGKLGGAALVKALDARTAGRDCQKGCGKAVPPVKPPLVRRLNRLTRCAKKNPYPTATCKSVCRVPSLLSYKTKARPAAEIQTGALPSCARGGILGRAFGPTRGTQVESLSPRRRGRQPLMLVDIDGYAELQVHPAWCRTGTARPLGT